MGFGMNNDVSEEAQRRLAMSHATHCRRHIETQTFSRAVLSGTLFKICLLYCYTLHNSSV